MPRIAAPPPRNRSQLIVAVAGAVALVAIGAGVILFQGVLAAAEACFQARRLLVYPAFFWAVQAAVTAAVGFVAVGLGAGPRGLAAALTVGYAAAIPIAFVLLVSRLGVRPELAETWRRIGPFVRTALPIAATGGMTIIYDRVDVLMLSKLDTTRAVAIYNVPLTILQYSMIVPAIIATAFFPLLAETLRTSPAQARESFGLLSRMFVLISVPVAIVLSAGGETVLTTLFGGRYRDSAAPLAVLAWSIVLGFFNYLLWYSLLAAYREGMKFVIMVVGLGLNVGLNLVLIPAYGPRGAAISLICSDLLVVLWQGVLVRRHLFAISLPGLLTKPLVAGAAGGMREGSHQADFADLTRLQKLHAGERMRRDAPSLTLRSSPDLMWSFPTKSIPTSTGCPSNGVDGVAQAIAAQAKSRAILRTREET